MTQKDFCHTCVINEAKPHTTLGLGLGSGSGLGSQLGAELGLGHVLGLEVRGSFWLIPSNHDRFPII